MARRELGEISAGSMADIAFLLLIFFLVTTTMDVDTGIPRKLPPILDNIEDPPPIRERNVHIVLINRFNQLAVEGQLAQISNLREEIKEFIKNPSSKDNLSEGVPLSKKLEKAIREGNTKKATKYKQALKIFGNMRISKGVVSLQNDRSTEYGMYIKVQNELFAAFNDLKDELATAKLGKKYEDLSEDEQKLVRLVYPLSISEAEPRNVGGNK